MGQINKNQENGKVSISEEVVATIAGLAASDVEGVSGLTSRLASDIKGIVSKKTIGKGIQVEINDESVVIDIFMNIKFGYKFVEVAEKVQSAVETAVESMTGLKVTCVNVNVVGVNIPKNSEE
ncbi:MAG: Asp23/Gls24 family envelope stress response protein [Clostridia bacterium]|nr:Asp23/Gls24 family envelope stress response protein [Clostridia bacterium]